MGNTRALWVGVGAAVLLAVVVAGLWTVRYVRERRAVEDLKRGDQLNQAIDVQVDRMIRAKNSGDADGYATARAEAIRLMTEMFAASGDIPAADLTPDVIGRIVDTFVQAKVRNGGKSAAGNITSTRPVHN